MGCWYDVYVNDDQEPWNKDYPLSKEEACQIYNAESGVFGILYINEDVKQSGNVQFITNSSSSLMLEELIQSQLKSIVEREKLKERYNIDNLDQMLADVAVPIALNTFENNGTGNEEDMESTSAGINYILGIILGMLLYMVIIIYGQMVLTSVVEEKSSRVIDVMVTSCSPFQLMMGKILGIASVALTQIAIWAVLVLAA